VALAPGALLHLAAFASRRFVMSHLAGENLDRMSYDKDSGVLAMDFVRSDCIPAGSWFTINLPEISRVEHHPFSACRLLLVNGGQTTIVRFLAKVNKDDPSSWTNRVAKRVEEAQTRDPLDIQVFNQYRLYGPYGVLEVSPKTYRHIFLVAGGMGITPHLLMLQQILINDTHSMGPTANKLSVTLLWSVRDPCVLEVFIHDLHALKGKLGQAYPNIHVEVRIFCTVPATPEGRAKLAPNPYVRTLGITCHERPDFDTVLDSLALTWAPHVQKAAVREARDGPQAPAAAGAASDPTKAVQAAKPKSESEIHTLNYSVATYISGPAEFTVAATNALKKKRGEFEFHAHAECFRF
jgi:hypothetical protein